MTTMNSKQYRNQFIEALTNLYGADEAESFFYLILENKHNLKRIDLALNPDLSFSEAQLEVWNGLLEQLKLEIPIQYLLGTTSFYGLEFKVNKNVLIPRPETEELVDWIIENQKSKDKNKPLKILDIGTGSGCIAISLAKNLPHAQVFALDVSEGALATAKENAKTNGVTIQFINQNILETTDLLQDFDIIVSNPPYVRELEKEEIKNNVLEHEPHLALFVPNNEALIFYIKITTLAQKNLVAQGELYFEINQYLGKEMIAMVQDFGFTTIELKKDIYENDRMLRALKAND